MFLFPEKNLGIFTTANGPGAQYLTPFPNTKLVASIFDIITGNSDSNKILPNQRRKLRNCINVHYTSNSYIQSDSKRSSSTKNINWDEQFPAYDVLNILGNNYTSDPTNDPDENDENEYGNQRPTTSLPPMEDITGTYGHESVGK